MVKCYECDSGGEGGCSHKLAYIPFSDFSPLFLLKRCKCRRTKER